MAAANPSTLSGGIPQPFHIILAGAHDAGKTTFFNTLVTEFKDSFKFKSDDKRSSRQGVQFESCHHKYLEDSKEVKLLLQDTAGMEKRGGVGTMTKTYFRQAVGVILVYDTSNLESLLKIKTWVEAAEETCVYSQHLIYTLWGNEKGSMYSSVNNPVEPDHLSALLAQLQSTLAKPIHIEDQLVCKMDATNQAAVTENYEILVRSIHRKVKEIDTVMKEASQRITLERPNVVENEEEMGQSRRCISSC